MSTDSTELTFVRCPSCRSLVPAVSTRCRMCGSAIDAQGKEATEPEAPRRARSNTTVQPSTEFVNATEAVRANETLEAAAAESDYEDFNPLRDYLDDDSPVSPEPVKSPASVPTRLSSTSQSEERVAAPVIEPATVPEPFDDDDFDIFGNDDADDDDWIDSVADEVPAPVEAREARVEQTMPAPVAEPKVEPPAPRSERPAPPQMNGGGSHGSTSAARESGKVVVESGARPAGKPSGLSFGKGRQEDQRPQPSRDTRPVQKGQGERTEKQNRPPQPQAKHAAPAPQERRDQRPAQETRKEPQQQQKQAAPAKQPAHERIERQPESRTPSFGDVQRVRQDAGKAPVHESVDSRLVGWLVSFSTPTRTSIELREGKFFVGGNSLKPNDLVLEDSSISTPHAMVAVDSGRLQVQDLMSEAGVYRRRQGESEFVQFGEPFDLKHGDWVRFGKVDFLVTMIPSDNKR